MMVPTEDSTEDRITDADENSPPRARMSLLTQMAETLEDQAAGLYRRAAASEEGEFLLNREIEERQTEISRMMLKLEGMRAERARLMEKISAISEEATAMREEIFIGEEEFALAALASSTTEVGVPGWKSELPAGANLNPASGHSYFHRMTLPE